MFDMTKLVPRYFALKLPNESRIDVEPPKNKTIKKMLSLSQTEEDAFTSDDFDNLIIALSMALSKNKQGRKISPEFIEENMNLDEMNELMKTYFDWVSEIKQSKN